MSGMNEHEESIYLNGRRRAFTEILGQCLDELGTSEPGLREVHEREYAISALRELCREFGDNDWPDNLWLPDIIEKRLGRPLRRRVAVTAIACSDRMPPEDTEVLFFVGGEFKPKNSRSAFSRDTPDRRWRRGKFLHDEWWDDSTFVGDDSIIWSRESVTHWQDFPADPRKHTLPNGVEMKVQLTGIVQQPGEPPPITVTSAEEARRLGIAVPDEYFRPVKLLHQVVARIRWTRDNRIELDFQDDGFSRQWAKEHEAELASCMERFTAENRDRPILVIGNRHQNPPHNPRAVWVHELLKMARGELRAAFPDTDLIIEELT